MSPVVMIPIPARWAREVLDLLHQEAMARGASAREARTGIARATRQESAKQWRAMADAARDAIAEAGR